MPGKLPAFLFYPGDWIKDPNLRRCTHNAKGVFMDVLCLMFESAERGVLITAQRPWSDDEIALGVGGNSDLSLSGLHELLEKGVLSRDDRGAIYSRRMVRDDKERRDNARRQQRFRDSNADSNGVRNAIVTPMSEDEDETEDRKRNGGGGGKGKPRPGCADAPPGFVAFWLAWPPHDRKNGRKQCLKLWTAENLESKAAEVIAGLKRWKLSEMWADQGGKFIPGPHHWLNEARWENQPKPKGQASNGASQRRSERAGGEFEADRHLTLPISRVTNGG